MIINKAGLSVTTSTTHVREYESNTYIKAATSDNTRKAYRAAIRKFESWGGRLPSNSEQITQYLLAHAELLNPNTLSLHLTALRQWHHYQGIDDPSSDPSVRKTLQGIKRVHGKPKRKAKALRLEHIASILKYLSQLPETNKRYRDEALVMVGFFGAFRRNELVSINIEDLSWEPEGLIVHIQKSKTDQESQGAYRAIPKGNGKFCPVETVRRWIDKAGINEGPVFRAVTRWDQVKSAQLYPGSVNEILKQIGEACDFEFIPELSSHSLRRGMSTSAARENIDFELIKRQGGWKSDSTVWQYIEEGNQLSKNAATELINKVNGLLLEL
ncbi:MAG: tyrosine-type recombinase/integrase [Pseudomonadales bacterium]|nr:tyrosine-type recombinase/integrase [Pseudomonadales bacterium]